MTETVFKTYRYRVKDAHAGRLSAQARAVNYVWNYCNETQIKAARARRRWLNKFDLDRLTAGSTKAGLDLLAGTVCLVARSYAQARERSRKPWLRWRSKRSRGWVPFRGVALHRAEDGFVFRRERYGVWLSRPIPSDATILSGSFNQDARGRWYINVVVSEPVRSRGLSAEIGIDLGLKTFATLSNGVTLEAPRPYRRLETALGIAQRARKKPRAAALGAKIANQRRDFLHKASTSLAKEFGLIVVGDVDPKKLAQTSMAKSVHDAGWSDFRMMLEYKALTHGSMFIEVNEAFTSRTCSDCGSVGGPKGIAGCEIRGWECADCGAVHDRDVNAALNILAAGRRRLAEGTVLAEASTDDAGVNSQ